MRYRLDLNSRDLNSLQPLCNRFFGRRIAIRNSRDFGDIHLRCCGDEIKGSALATMKIEWRLSGELELSVVANGERGDRRMKLQTATPCVHTELGRKCMSECKFIARLFKTNHLR